MEEVAVFGLQIVTSPSSLLHFGPRSEASAALQGIHHDFPPYQDSPALAAEADKLMAAIVERRQGIPA